MPTTRSTTRKGPPRAPKVVAPPAFDDEAGAATPRAQTASVAATTAAGAGAGGDDRALRIELAALASWPALTDTDFDGWRLRFSDGYTRRANSITPIGRSRLPLDQKIDACERLYGDRGLPAIFRIPSFAAPEVDQALAARGYRRGDVTEVRARPFDGTPPLPGPRRRSAAASGAPRAAIAVREHGLDRWLDIFAALAGARASHRPVHRAILGAAPGRRRLLALWASGRPVACGMSVLHDGMLGLFDLVTAPEERNRGYGSELLARALDAGARAGAGEAYLQVLLSNAAALHIYDRVGFRPVYRYHYRER